MRKFCLSMLIIVLCACPMLAHQRWAPDSAMLKARQKEQLRALKLKQKYARQELQHSRLPKPVRTQLRHELKQEQRKLRQRQKEERQSLKDREKLLDLEMKQLELE